jgi:hypothetical protein
MTVDIEIEPEGERNDDGSDSDPSVDNIPAFKLFGKKNVGGLRDSKNLIKALYKSVRKRRRVSENKDAKKERKRILEEQEAGQEERPSYRYMHTYVCIFLFLYFCIFVFLYICIYIYMYVYICIYIYIYLYIYIHIHVYEYEQCV